MKKKKINIEEKVEELANHAIQEEKSDSTEDSPIDHTEPKTKESEGKPKRKKASIRDLIDGSILTREYVLDQMPFIFFVTFLAMIYIANKYDSEKIVRDTVSIKNELKELRCEKISIHSELDSISRQSSVIRLIQEKNLEIKQLVEPPIKIIINTDTSKQKNNLASNK